MKIVNIIHRYSPAIGGSENWCKGACRYMSGRGLNTEVLTLNVYNEEEYLQEPRADRRFLKLGRLEYNNRVRVTRYQRSLYPRFKGPHSFEMYFKMILRVKDADIVHLHAFPYFHNFIGCLVAKICGKKVIFIPHFHSEHPMYELKSNYWLMKKCNLILAVSEYEKKYLVLKGIEAARIFVVGNGIEPAYYQKKGYEEFKKDLFERYDIKDNTKILVFVGRKIEYKNIDILIEAVKQLSEHREIRLFLAGPEMEWFKKLYLTLSEEERKIIVDLGVISQQDKANLLHLSDLLVLPSKHEAFGIVFLEAWICNVPVIGIKECAASEIIGSSGLTVNYRDIDDLKEKIGNILDNPKLAHDMALDGKNKVLDNYTWDKVGQKVYSCYNILTKNKFKILIVSSFFPPYCIGGAEIIAFEQARILKELGHDVMVFCGKVNNLIEQYRFTRENNISKIVRVNLHNSDVGADSFNLENEVIQKKFRQLLSDFSPDIVHFHSMNSLPVKLIDEANELNIPTVMTLLDCCSGGIKNDMLVEDVKVCSENSFDSPDCKKAIPSHRPVVLETGNAPIKASFDKVDKFISPTEFLAQAYIRNGFPKDKISIIRDGIIASKYITVRIDCFRKVIRFGCVESMSEHKDVEYLITAFSTARYRNKAILYLVGKRGKINYYKKLCHQLNLNGHVKFIVIVDNQRIRKIYKKLDVLVLPSACHENTRGSILKGMASGLAILATNTGGISELVEDKITGLFFIPKDVSDLSGKIEYCISNPEEVNRMGQKGLEKIEDYDLKNRIRETLNLYGKMLKI